MCSDALSDGLVFAGHNEKDRRPVSQLWRKVGRGTGSEPPALVLNSSGPLPGLIFLSAKHQLGFGFGILLMQTCPSFFCKQTTFLRCGGNGPSVLSSFQPLEVLEEPLHLFTTSGQ